MAGNRDIAHMTLDDRPLIAGAGRGGRLGVGIAEREIEPLDAGKDRHGPVAQPAIERIAAQYEGGNRIVHPLPVRIGDAHAVGIIGQRRGYREAGGIGVGIARVDRKPVGLGAGLKKEPVGRKPVTGHPSSRIDHARALRHDLGKPGDIGGQIKLVARSLDIEADVDIGDIDAVEGHHIAGQRTGLLGLGRQRAEGEDAKGTEQTGKKFRHHAKSSQI